jgi:hypothetical protein
MYTLEMASAFKSIQAPESFGVVIFDNEDFLTVQIDPQELLNLSGQSLDDAVQYIKDVKKALEDNGAIVLLVREVLEK